jgi:ribosome-associated toxin RatA of RatAB toxin-antitoxin module
MTTVNKSALVPYSASEMYALVADIEAYGEFLPWCGGTRIVRRDGDDVTAAINIAYSAVNQTFTTQNRGTPGVAMEMRLVQGPFRHLHGRWQFQALDEQSCKVSLHLEFEFASKMLGLLVGPVFNKIANGLVDSFRQRAVQLYGVR